MSQFDYERFSHGYDHLPHNIHYQRKIAHDLTSGYQPNHPTVKIFFTVFKVLFALMVLLCVAVGVSS